MTKLRFPENCIDVTDQARGTVITLVGEVVHKQKIAMAKKQVRDLPAADRELHLSEGTDDSHRAAWHEAGHAIIGRVLGVQCGQATIAADGVNGYAIAAGQHAIHNDLIATGAYQGREPTKIGTQACSQRS